MNTEVKPRFRRYRLLSRLDRDDGTIGCNDSSGNVPHQFGEAFEPMMFAIFGRHFSPVAPRVHLRGWCAGLPFVATAQPSGGPPVRIRGGGPRVLGTRSQPG